MNLQLSLKKEWFEMTKKGIKKEDYREITPYWCNRLALFEGEKMSKRSWRNYLLFSGINYMKICSKSEHPKHHIMFIKARANIMTSGYPKSTDKDRIIKLEHKGIEIRTGDPDWGAEPGKLYFVIKHGELV